MLAFKKSSLSPQLNDLEEELALLLGIQTKYKSNFGATIYAEKKNFQAIVRAMVDEAESELETEELVVHLKKKLSTRLLREYLVLTPEEAQAGSIRLTLNPSLETKLLAVASKELAIQLELESGKILPTSMKLLDGSYILDESLPLGVHRLRYMDKECLILVAPKKGKELPEKKAWGFFAPLYALHSKNSMGAGDYGDFEAFTDYAASLGAKTVATLPLLPTFLSEWKEDPSPYSPVSRVFWSEFYVDPRKAPEWNLVPEAREIFESLESEIKKLNAEENVPYLKVFELKQKILKPMAKYYFEEGEPGRLQSVLKEKHDLVQYARFRAYCDVQAKPWSSWPEAWLRDLPPSHETKELEQLYLYMQLLACEQIQAVAVSAREKDLSFYLDLPVGVHGDGYDVYKNSELYVRKLSAGAPPDPFFSLGQNWGFPPLNPRTLMNDKLSHLRQIIRHHVSHAALLRVDHVMGLHRIYVVPHGFEASEGLYITYPEELFYGVLLLEAQRTGAVIVGEDLGTVPNEVVLKMAEHKLSRLYVMQYEANPENADFLGIPSEHSVASINTHDMPMWQAYWDATDLDDRLERGLLDKRGAAQEAEIREQIRAKSLKLFEEKGLLSAAVGVKPRNWQLRLKAALSWMMQGASRMALVTLEDLWAETEPQNTPGTYKEKPNWKRRCDRSLDELVSDSELSDFLREIASNRTRH